MTKKKLFKRLNKRINSIKPSLLKEQASSVEWDSCAPTKVNYGYAQMFMVNTNNDLNTGVCSDPTVTGQPNNNTGNLINDSFVFSIIFKSVS